MICNIQMINILMNYYVQMIIIHKIFLQVIFTKDITNDNFTNDIKPKKIIKNKLNFDFNIRIRLIFL